jgi:hypothetical protein
VVAVVYYDADVEHGYDSHEDRHYDQSSYD